VIAAFALNVIERERDDCSRSLPLVAMEFLINSTTISISACGTALPIGNNGDLCLFAK
jgi:hypothetical protein